MHPSSADIRIFADMNFRTEITPQPPDWAIALPSQLLSLGSCFADRIGRRLAEHKFHIWSNPFGVIFNPLSLHHLLQVAMGNEQWRDMAWVATEGTWRHLDLHSQWAHPTQHTLHTEIQSLMQGVHEWLANTDVLMLTWGTAWVYVDAHTQQIVANCHKQPAARFEKRLLSLNEIMADACRLMDSLQQYRPTLKVLLSISPVRHAKDTLVLNQVSKATLRLAAHQLTQQYPMDRLAYFPAYELLLDDLRDYRFYAEDMLHPSLQAEEYIWQKFIAGYITQDTQHFIKEWQGIRQALAHRPLHNIGTAHRTFLEKLKIRLLRLADVVNIEAELAEIHQRLYDGNAE